MLKRIFNLLLLLIVLSQTVLLAQTNDSIPQSESGNLTVNYTSPPKSYYVADIKVTGVEETMYAGQEFVLINFAGLSKGQEIQIPGNDITNALKRFWRQGLFSDVKILQNKIEGDSVWLEIRLTDRPRVTDIHYTGMKKSEQDKIEEKIGFVKGNQITPPQIDRAKLLIKSFYDEKGFGDAEIKLLQHPDASGKNQVILEIIVDKKEKLKVNNIKIEGNEALSNRTLKRAMKKTNEKGKLWNIFRAKKFVEDLYEEDKTKLLGKYHEKGYRDAEILKDTVYKYNEKTVNIDIFLEEGPLYHIRSVNWVGNTQYPSAQLSQLLNMTSGDIYNQKKLEERLIGDEDAVINLYQNNGYLFSNIDPIEINIENDSIDLELRVVEGPKATIKRVIIQGNDRLYEDVIRRELRTKPGAIFSKDDLLRSVREIAQTGHFDPEALSADIGQGISPNPDDGTVDITYPLTSKGNDQIEFSAGWGVTGLVGKLSLRLNNFSLRNLINPSMHKGIIPQGDGQTLVLSGQTNGQYYQSYQFQFIEPWFGGKKPNQFSVNAYYSRYTGLNSDYYQQNANPYMYGYGGYPGYGYGSYGGYGGYGYGGYGGYGGYQDLAEYAADPDQVFNIFGASIGYGKRLEWPDDYFQIMASIGYQRYKLKNWTLNRFDFSNGVSNSITFGLTLSRTSIDNPIYTRTGSEFTLSVNATPPFSLWDGNDYSKMENNDPKKHKWNE